MAAGVGFGIGVMSGWLLCSYVEAQDAVRVCETYARDCHIELDSDFTFGVYGRGSSTTKNEEEQYNMILPTSVPLEGRQATRLYHLSFFKLLHLVEDLKRL